MQGAVPRRPDTERPSSGAISSGGDRAAVFGRPVDRFRDRDFFPVSEPFAERHATTSDRARTAAALVATIVAACQFQAPPDDGTRYSCAGGAACPTGFTCAADLLCRRDADGPDAAPPADGSLPDAAVPDGPPPDTGPRTLVFGEGSAADVRGVTADTTLDSSAPTTPLGASSELVMDTSPRRVTLIRFDLRAIPTGSVIDDAELVWTVFDPQPSNDARAQALVRPWSEASATWAEASAGVAWPNAGASGAAVDPAIVATFVPAADGVYTVAIDAAVVQRWVDDPSGNFGLRWDSTAADGNNLRLHSREGGDADRPSLRVTFH